MNYRRECFNDEGELPWLDRPDADEAIEARLSAGEIDAAQAAQLHKWVRDGYIIVEDVLDAETVEGINADVEAIVKEFKHLPIEELRFKIQDIFPHSESTKRAICLPEVYSWIDLLLGVRALPYQTLNLPLSSQLSTHTDEILMTTQPPGYLAAIWFALEDISDKSGPLVVYPGSHRQPYLSAEEVGIPIGVDEAGCSKVYDSNYYGMMNRRLEGSGCKPFVFLPKQGSALIWHSNLMHGALATVEQGMTRKSLIAHYYGDGVLHYSDLFQRPCHLPGLR